jgi:PIN domain nuclease of toxin-antitoxin system
VRRLVSSNVLDASALLILLKQELGTEEVLAALAEGSAMSTVNISEVVAKLSESGMPVEEIRAALAPLEIKAIPFDLALAYRAGLLRAATRHLGLSLGDRACLATALALDQPALTADRSWQQLDIGAIVRVPC